MKISVSTSMLLATSMLFASPASAAITDASDPILFWNSLALTTLTGPVPRTTRAHAMVNIAMHDAVNSVLGGPNRGYLSSVMSFGGDPRAAASQAAYDVLRSFNPGAQPALKMQLDAILLQINDPVARAAGVETGKAYASAIITQRSTDKSANPMNYIPGTAPGAWRPTGSGNASLPQWGQVTPFLMSSGDQFRPQDGPPALGSAAYVAAYNEIKAIGSITSQADGNRSTDQSASAAFWLGANGATWLEIGLKAADGTDLDLSTLELAGVFAKLMTGAADSQVAGFDAKYFYNLWRPVTAIQVGGPAGDGVDADPSWTPQNAAPPHPSFVSTLSALSGASATVLADAFGDNPFGDGTSLTIGSNSREWNKFSEAALDASNSRLWGGIHYRFDNEAGRLIGEQIGALALVDDRFNAVPEPTSWALMIGGFGLVGAALRRRVTKVAFARA